MADAQTAPAPLTLGKYVLVQPIGTGGMAQVWLARKSMGAIDKAVALKVSADFVGFDPQRRGGILNEVRIAGRMRHSNIVSVMDAGEFGGVVYIELELIDGQDLRQFLEDLRPSGKMLPFSLVAYILRCILEGLNYAHADFVIDGVAQRVVHRDLTPSNVILSTSGEVKIIDFGISKYYDDRTSGHHIKGKPRYMAPEHTTGSTGPSIDIFAVGAILYELIEGRKFRDEIPSADLYVMAAQGVTPRIERADTPAAFVRLYDGLVAKNERARVHSAAAAIAMLDAWDGRPAQASELRALVRLQTGGTRSGYTHGEFAIPPGIEAAIAVANARADAEARAAVGPRVGSNPAATAVDAGSHDVPQPRGDRTAIVSPLPHASAAPRAVATETLPPPQIAAAETHTFAAAPSASVRPPSVPAVPAASPSVAAGWSRGRIVAVALATCVVFSIALGLTYLLAERDEPPVATQAARATEERAIAAEDREPSVIDVAAPPVTGPTLVVDAPPAPVTPPAIVQPSPTPPPSEPPEAAPAVSPAPKKQSPPAPPVAVRIVSMLADGDLAIGKKVFSIGGPAQEVTLPSGKHTVRWRAKDTSEWISRPKLVLVAGRRHLLQVSDTAVRHVVREDP